MPVTAKLSKAFYDKFGDAVVDELVNWFNQVDTTYKLELRDFNELNFARFDAKLEQRLADLRAELHADFADLRAEFTDLRGDTRSGLARLEGGLLARIGQVEGRLARLTLVLWLGTLGTLIALLKL